MSKLDIVLLTGISGSGKSVALNALEDAGYFCVDNLPPELLSGLISLEETREAGRRRRVAVAVDVRSADSLPHLLPVLQELRQDGHKVRSVFLDASTDALVRRFSETRRPHPLSQVPQPAPADATPAPLQRRRARDHDTTVAPPADQALVEAIRTERELLSPLREVSTVIDTSLLRPAQLRAWIRNIVQAAPSRLTLVFESFAFKQGVPMDADFVFDVRMLPNPFYIKELKPLTGRDQPVIDYLAQQPESAELIAQIEAFLLRWLPALEGDQRSYVTVAIGCTGGQHRSVYCVEQLMQRFSPRGVVLSRHRELDAK
ncbi:MAG: RNase adapter RapZ [Proteobacteria bacterium]|uniref:RNase adapter RapZ n=1 Tax=Aquabacterium sp. TaxID=1872578 RepID=UPI0035C6BCB2|nr:RNase adapter RapZ [Pseudomonadota bacterium]